MAENYDILGFNELNSNAGLNDGTQVKLQKLQKKLQIYGDAVVNEILAGDGKNEAALEGLLCTEKNSIKNVREFIALVDSAPGKTGSETGSEVSAPADVLNACEKVLGASRADMEKRESDFHPAVLGIAAFCKPENLGVKNPVAAKLLSAYIEVALLHAFTRGTEEICIEASDGLKDAGTRFTGDVLARLKEKYAAAMEDCTNTINKADISRKFAIRYRARKAATAAGLINTAAKVADELVLRSRLAGKILFSLQTRQSDCGNLAWKNPSQALLSRLEKACNKACNKPKQQV